MADAGDQKPKIIIDDDWKQQAQREKEEADRLTREERRQDIPAPSVLELVQMIVMQISIGLGGMQDPATGQAIPPSLPLAKHYIDLLEVLNSRTKGNLDENEQKIMQATLHEVRMAFVQIVSELQGGAGSTPESPGTSPA